MEGNLQPVLRLRCALRSWCAGALLLSQPALAWAQSSVPSVTAVTPATGVTQATAVTPATGVTQAISVSLAAGATQATDAAAGTELTAGETLWGEITIPGGAAAARVVAVLDGAPMPYDAGLVLDFIRRYSGTGVGQPADGLERYFRAVDGLRASQASWPDGLALPAPNASEADRDAIGRALEAFGLNLERRDGRYEVVEDGSGGGQQRRHWLRALGADAATLIEDLNAGRRAIVRVVDSAAPLPLPGFWTAEVFERGESPLMALLRDRHALLTYHGLMALDDETLGFLADRPRLLGHIYRGPAARFATFGRSFRIKAGALDTPGGDEMRPTWQRLTGCDPRDAERFIESVLQRDAGRLAYFYDTVAHLEPERQRFLLGAHLPGSARAEFVAQVYATFVSIAPEWQIDIRPFDRLSFDAVIPLATVDLQPGGVVGPSWWPSLFDRVIGSSEWPGPDRSPTTVSDRPADARWLLSFLFKSRDASLRFRLLRFAQRHPLSADLASAPALEVALRALVEMPSLALALERMGVRDPVLVARLAQSARRLTHDGGAEDVLPRLARWQMGFGLLEQIHRRVRLDDDRRNALLGWLADLAALPADEARGGVAAWVHDRLLPALLDDPAPGPDLEPRVMRAAMRPAVVASRPVEWEGLPYVAAPWEPAIRDALAILRLRRGPHLEDLLELHRVRRRIEMREDSRALAAELSRIAASAGIRSIGPQVPALVETIDAVTDVVLASWLYALAVTPTPEPRVYPDLWSAHSLWESDSADETRVKRPWRVIAWQAPEREIRRGGGVRLLGSYLALDVALAESRLVRLPSAAPPDVRAVADVDRVPVVEALAVTLPEDFERPESALVPEVLARGRARVAGWKAAMPDRRTLAATLRQSGIDEWRAALIAWGVGAGHQTALDLFTPVEIYRLAGGGALPAGWSGAAMSIDGCLCRGTPRPLTRADLRGRRIGLQALTLQDLPLRLAEHLSSMRLEMRLIPLILPAATQDWLDQLPLQHPDDWESAAAWPRDLPLDRVEAYVLHLVTTGVLAPPETVENGDRSR